MPQTATAPARTVLADLTAPALAALRAADRDTGHLPTATPRPVAAEIAAALGLTEHTPGPAARRIIRAAAAILRCAERDRAHARC